MASSTNSNPVPKLYRTVIEDVINDVRELFLDEGVDEQVLIELKTLWESKLMQSKAVDGFHSEEQQLLLQAQQQQQQQHQHSHHQQHHLPQQQHHQQQAVQHQTQTQQVLIPATHQVPQQQVIMQDPKLIQHMNTSGMSAAAAAATLALPGLPAGVTPVQQILTNSGQILQLVRTANGAQYIIQPQQQMLLQQQVIPQMQPGVQAPVIQQVLAPMPGGMQQQAGVIIQPQQILFTGNKTQVIPTTIAPATQAQGPMTVAAQQQAQQHVQQQVQQQVQQHAQQQAQLHLQQQHAQQQAQAHAQQQHAQQQHAQQQAQQQHAQQQAQQQHAQQQAQQQHAQQQAQQQHAQQQAQQQHAQQQAQQQHVQQQPLVLQVDGAGDTSSEEDEDEDEDYDEDEEEDKEKDGEDGQVEEEPLNSGDDVSDEEGQELFDTENVVVCQYDKIHRSKNKWKFHLKDGIMNLNGRDYVFSKAVGDAEW